MSGKLLLLVLGQNRGCALIMRSAITQASQAQGVIALQDLPGTGDGILGERQQFSFALALGNEGEELRSAPFDGARAGPEDGPEVGSGVLKLDASIEAFDPPILHDLIGIRIRHSLQEAVCLN